MAINIKNQIYKIFSLLGYNFAKLTEKYYFEDFVRVYPNGIIFNRYGIRKKASDSDIKNFRNHSKFYIFVSQFVKKRKVSDIGCGSGYGCQILKQAKAKSVYGTDASSPAIRFAVKNYGKYAKFSIQSITDIRNYKNDAFDITISSEVLEHIKEYNKEELAITELKRITKPKGLIIIGTPNSEMLSNHGFSFDEIDKLAKKHFSKFVIFENALIPFGKLKNKWEERVRKGKTGVIISEKISFKETLLPLGVIPQTKKGLAAGKYKFGPYSINTSLLHNTHSWIIIAIN